MLAGMMFLRLPISIDHVWTDVLTGLQWLVSCFGGLTGMLARETGFSGARRHARRLLRHIEYVLRRLLVVEATKLDRPPAPARREVRRGGVYVHPRSAPDAPQTWSASFRAPSPCGLKPGVLANAPRRLPVWDRDDLAPLARRMEAIRRVLADLPRHARRWARHLGELAEGAPRRARRPTPLQVMRCAADDFAREALARWRSQSWDTS
jgi:hypothetical protein